jgi:hypothetical protein
MTHGSWNTGDLNPGTGGNRDTYNPEVGDRTGQAEYSAELERKPRPPSGFPSPSAARRAPRDLGRLTAYGSVTTLWLPSSA